MKQFETIEDYEKLIDQLEAPTGYGGTNSEDSYEIFDDLRVKAAGALHELLEHYERADALLEGRVSDTRLVKFGPGEEGWEMELKEGIIPFIAQYMIEVMNMDTENPLNFVSIDVQHHERGSLELILQRKDGKRPAEMVTELKTEVAELESKIAWYEWWLSSAEMMSNFQDALSYYGGDFSVAPPTDET